jgi:hypothetical protein
MISKQKHDIPDNSKCLCGSEVKYKNCCKPYSRRGPLAKKLHSNFNDIHTTFIFEINSIMGNICIDSLYLDKLCQSMVDLFSLSERALEDCKKHSSDLKNDVGMHKNDTTWIVDDFDHRINFYIRHLFIDGGVVKDALCRLAGDLGFNIDFLFGDEDNKKFQANLSKLASKFSDKNEAKKFIEFIKLQKEEWLTEFVLSRNSIEHGLFKIEQVEYKVNKYDKLLPQFPTVNKMNSVELFQIYPLRFFYFCREITIFLLGELVAREKFPDGAVGALVRVSGDEMPWGDLNKEKKLFKFGLLDEATGEIITTNFSRSCQKKDSKQV